MREIFNLRLQNTETPAIVHTIMNTGVKETIYNSLMERGIGEQDAYELAIEGKMIEVINEYVSDSDDNVALWGSYDGVATTATGETVLI